MCEDKSGAHTLTTVHAATPPLVAESSNKLSITHAEDKQRVFAGVNQSFV